MLPDRLSAQDTTFLYLEGPRTPYHVASLLIFDGHIDFETFVGLVDGRLHLVPRFRQRLLEAPLGSRPLWVDDEDFDLRYHVRHSALPRPGTEEQLVEACSHLMEQHLSRSRPLWEIYLIAGLEGDRTAVFAKTHHAMIDGMAGVDAAAVLLDDIGTPRPTPHAAWAPRPRPSDRRLAIEAAREIVATATGPMAKTLGLLRHPRRLLASAAELAAEVGALVVASFQPAPASPLNLPIGPNRRVAVVRTSFEDFRSVKDRFEATVNDVVLAVVSGALRTWMTARGLATDGPALKAMVPVSVRTADDDGSSGNRVSSILVPLPVGEPDPVRRLRTIREATKEAKSSRQVAGADLMIQISGMSPTPVLAQIAKVQNVQRFFNVTVTNIRGPAQALYGGGYVLLDLFPFAPLPGNSALIVAVMSYAGRMEFGLTADAAAIPDLPVIAQGLEAAIDELVAAAGPARLIRPA